ncbi:MAG TPA: D-glycerate dehydrogenase, partial [Rhodothermales bacterium]
MPDVVITRPLPEAGLQALYATHDVHVLQDGIEVTEQRLIDEARRARALLTLLTDPVTERVFEECA